MACRRSACRCTSARTLLAVAEALRVARSTGLPVPVLTIAGGGRLRRVTNVVRSCAGDGRFGAAAQVLSAYLDSDLPVAVSELHQRADHLLGRGDRRSATVRRFAERCRQRVAISYPAINTPRTTSTSICRATAEVLSRRGLMRDGYVLLPVQARPRQRRRRLDHRLHRQPRHARN